MVLTDAWHVWLIWHDPLRTSLPKTKYNQCLYRRIMRRCLYNFGQNWSVLYTNKIGSQNTRFLFRLKWDRAWVNSALISRLRKVYCLCVKFKSGQLICERRMPTISCSPDSYPDGALTVNWLLAIILSNKVSFCIFKLWSVKERSGSIINPSMLITCWG